jgi:hypothetical protein
MSTTFTRSTRALSADEYGRVNWALLVAIVFLLAWIGWFLLARVSLYEVSSSAQLTAPTRIIAHFPPTALIQIQQGQSAQMRLDDFRWTEYGTVAATVVRVDESVQDGLVEVELAIPADTQTAIPLQASLTGQVEVEVGRISPAALLLNRIETGLTTTGEAEAGTGE